MDEQFAFSDDELPGPVSQRVWRVLAVDDDVDFQRATAFALSELEVLGGVLS